MADDVRMNMAGLIEISNLANEKIAEPLAQRIVSSAGSGYEVRTTGRSSIPGWGRTRIFTTSVQSMLRERRDGTLARALGGSGGETRVRYTTRSGTTRWASQAQVSHWTRGR